MKHLLKPKFLLVVPCTTGVINDILSVGFPDSLQVNGCNDSNASHSPVSRFIHDPWSLQHKQPIPGPRLRAEAEKASGPWPVRPVWVLKIWKWDAWVWILHDAHTQWEVNQIKIKLGPFPYILNPSRIYACMHSIFRFLKINQECILPIEANS